LGHFYPKWESILLTSVTPRSNYYIVAVIARRPLIVWGRMVQHPWQPINIAMMWSVTKWIWHKFLQMKMYLS